MPKMNLLKPNLGIYGDKIVSYPLKHREGYTFFTLKISFGWPKCYYTVSKVKPCIRYKEN